MTPLGNPIIMPHVYSIDLVSSVNGLLKFNLFLNYTSTYYQTWSISFPINNYKGIVKVRFLILYPNSMSLYTQPKIYPSTLYTNPAGIAPSAGTTVTQSLPQYF